MEQVTPLFPRQQPMFSVDDPAAEQERCRSAAYALRDLMEAAPAVVSFDPHSIAALIGLIADALPQWPGEDDD